MPLTAAERMRKRRENLKMEGKYDEYRAKIRESTKKSRSKKKKLISELCESKRKKILLSERKKVRERVAKHRILKKLQKTNINQSEDSSSSSLFSTPQSLGKAVARVRKVLPKCPKKKKVIVAKLLNDLDTAIQAPSTPIQHASALNEDTVKTIVEFYQREDISRQAPGLKDFITNRVDGKKEKVQIRHLYASVTETHAIFVKEYGVIVGRSKFAELRPKHVYLSSRLPHNVCLCKHHENYALALNALHKAIGSPRYSHDFISTVICEEASKDCWLYKCKVCESTLKHKLYDHAGENLHIEIIWYEWRDLDAKLNKVQETGTVIDLIDHILDMTPAFYTHSYIKRVQADAYNKDRLASSSNQHDPSVALVQVDFSENFTCIAQDEVQSYHWVQPQVTLFTVSMWVNGKQQPIVIVSDNRNHNKDTVVVYMDKILRELPGHVTEVHVWSDGPSSQFKNKFIAASLEILEKRHNKHIFWKFFATSHGKGPVDGIGGALKRVVRNRIIRREAFVTNAKQFAQTAKDSTVNVINVTPEEIEQTAKEIDLDNIFAQAKPLPGISKAHVMFWKDGQIITAPTLEEVNVAIKVKLSMYEQVYGSDSSDSSDDDIPLAQLRFL